MNTPDDSEPKPSASVLGALDLFFQFHSPAVQRALLVRVDRIGEHGTPNTFKASELEGRERRDAYQLGRLVGETPESYRVVRWYDEDGDDCCASLSYSKGWFGVQPRPLVQSGRGFDGSES